MILIIDNRKRAARNLADMFSYMGFLCAAATPSEALSTVSTLYRAIIVTSPTALIDKADYLRRLRSYAPDIPIFAMTDDESLVSEELFDCTLDKNAFAAKLAERVMDYCDSRALDIPGHYSLAGLDVSADLNCAMYFDKVLPFTKTECMILRYLVRSYPRTVNAESILHAVYRPSKMPDVANIRTHVSIINKKFRQVTGRSLIQQSFGEGYKLLAVEKEPALSV
ncbi:MAG: winged helix-turn-helix domain-containing protein [Clostridia bacterium]|nr:winged helix-turn-helix domain-containing protein [Clostridia bacterium]